jgi:hypothetical protein
LNLIARKHPMSDVIDVVKPVRRKARSQTQGAGAGHKDGPGSWEEAKLMTINSNNGYEWLVGLSMQGEG